MLKLNEIRNLFLKFFAANGHHILPSSSLVPQHDPTLMFTNAGMVPFKDYFVGNKESKFNMVASAQKCVRAGGKHNDLENVGYTNRHHTFFEMLGNFSFGAYKKEQAISLAWKFITKELSLPKEKIYVTVYHTDDESANLWKSIASLPSDRVIHVDSNDNFWSMGESGPCGPCSEIFYDHGDNGLPASVTENEGRFTEIWNLVFMQYNRGVSGEETSLPNMGIDTGMGLERITAVMQGVVDNYETDLFQELITKSQELSGDIADNTAHKIITDHLRSSAFLIADGVMPSNQGRGYVLRRIIRRAVRYVYQMGCNKPLLCHLFPTLSSYMGEAYPELLIARDAVKHTLETEERNFLSTLENGLDVMNVMIKNLKSGDTLTGLNAFKLYDTYGFPIDITIDLLKEKSIKVDEIGFHKEMDQQKKRARSSWVGSGETQVEKLWFEILERHGKTEFIDQNNSLCEVVEIIHDNKILHNNHVVNGGDEVIIILKQTPFYAESGGQLGDTGTLTLGETYIKVLDTKKILNSIHVHICRVESCGMKAIDLHCRIKASFDEKRRGALRVAHSATHLLHFALRKIVGKHVSQKGSMVAEDRLRFDFSHDKALQNSELQEIENTVNTLIWENSLVSIDSMMKESAVAQGAMALFGEKYGDTVRVVKMGNSIELCGGTHVKMTGAIGILKIIKEGSIGSGVRRIEALTRSKANEYMCIQKEQYIAEINSCKKKIKEEEKKYQNEEIKLYGRLIKSIEPQVQQINDLVLITKIIVGIPMNAIRPEIMNYSHGKLKSIILFFVTYKQKSACVISISKDLIGQVSAINLVKCVDKDLFKVNHSRGKAELAHCNINYELSHKVCEEAINIIVTYL